MSELFRNRLTAVWFFLAATTLFSWWFSAQHGAGAHDVGGNVAIAVLLAALIKGGLVMWYFMEVRDAPAWLRWMCVGWLVLFFGATLALAFRAF